MSTNLTKLGDRGGELDELIKKKLRMGATNADEWLAKDPLMTGAKWVVKNLKKHKLLGYKGDRGGCKKCRSSSKCVCAPRRRKRKKKKKRQVTQVAFQQPTSVSGLRHLFGMPSVLRRPQKLFPARSIPLSTPASRMKLLGGYTPPFPSQYLANSRRNYLTNLAQYTKAPLSLAEMQGVQRTYGAFRNLQQTDDFGEARRAGLFAHERLPRPEAPAPPVDEEVGDVPLAPEIPLAPMPPIAVGSTISSQPYSVEGLEDQAHDLDFVPPEKQGEVEADLRAADRAGTYDEEMEMIRARHDPEYWGAGREGGRGALSQELYEPKGLEGWETPDSDEHGGYDTDTAADYAAEQSANWWKSAEGRHRLAAEADIGIGADAEGRTATPPPPMLTEGFQEGVQGQSVEDLIAATRAQAALQETHPSFV